MKHDVQGNQKWSLSFGGASIDFISDIKTIGDTSIVVVGYYRSSIKLDTATLAAPPANTYNLVVAMLDSAGKVQWTKTAEVGAAPWGLFNNNYNPTIDVNSNGEIAVGGTYRASAKFNSTSISAATSNGIGSFVASYTLKGKFKWVKNISPSNTFSFATRVTIDDNSAVYASGIYAGSLTVDSKTISASGSRDVFLIKIDTAGKAK